MATTSRVGLWEWSQGDDSADSSRVGLFDWEQVEGAGSPPTFNPAWARNSNTVIVAATGADQK